MRGNEQRGKNGVRVWRATWTGMRFDVSKRVVGEWRSSRDDTKEGLQDGV